MSIESRVKFNHETAEKEQARVTYCSGQHFFVITGAEKKESKEKPEMAGVTYKMLKITLKPVRDPADITTVVGRGITVHQCLPFWDEAWDELDYEVQQKDGSQLHVLKVLERNMTIFNESIRDMFNGLMPDEVPARPIKQADGSYLYKGESIAAEDYKDSNTESKAVAGDIAERLWNDGPEELIGKGCFGLLVQKEGSQWPEMKRYGNEQLTDWKTGEVIDMVPPESIMGASEEAEEVVEEEAPPAKGVNGAKGKPTASKATVAAAAKAKPKSTSKSARR